MHMARIKLVLLLFLVVLTGLWIWADPVIFGAHPFQQFQFAFVQYSGITAMAVMAASLLLALRSVAIEPYVGGLDKSYRLHKWMGVTALAMIVTHFLFINAPDWLGLGASAPQRGAGASAARRPPPPPPSLLHTLQGPAKAVGSWCFYIGVLLILLALLRWFPYRQFIRTHRLLAVVYLFLVFHSLLLLKTAYWTHAIAWAIAALMAAGTVAAVYILVHRVGRTRQAVGKIENVNVHQDGRIVSVTVCLEDDWSGHDAGQFAFVRFHEGERAHPFTISSAWRDDGVLTFLIKGLGDYTSDLPETLAVGSMVTVEGPYGRFNFEGPHERQIWISAGIGITPFIARMQQLAGQAEYKIIDLFHATGSADVRVNDQLWRLATAAGVRLHVFVSGEDGRLTAEHICNGVPDWKDSDIWFCGPVQFGKALRRSFLDGGLRPAAFHQELFHLR